MLSICIYMYLYVVYQYVKSKCRWEMHGTILKSLQKQAIHIHAWWDFTGRPDPGIDGVVESLKRLVSGVLTHPITIGNIL